MNSDIFLEGKCGCGRDLRYSHGSLDVMSCNKYVVCLTYEEQEGLIKKLTSKVNLYKSTLSKIVRVNVCDYEYKAWAREALTEGGGLHE